MGSTTNIEWTDATWNPIRGCSRVSEGCRNCYAEKVAYRFSGPGQPYEGLVGVFNSTKKPVWNGTVQFAEKHLLDPLRWGPVITGCLTGREIPHAKKGHCPSCTERPRRIFVNSMSDLFQENVPDEWIDKIFAVMALCPQHQFQILTKRPERMLKYLTERTERNLYREGATGLEKHYAAYDRVFSAMVAMLKDVPAHALNRAAEWQDERFPNGDGFLRCWPLRNVWLGVSVENQAADARLDYLCEIADRGWNTMVSFEPLLGAVDPGGWWLSLGPRTWAICGGESGPGARPMHPDWARSLRDQCQAAGVPFFFKQWGEWKPYRQSSPGRLLSTAAVHAWVHGVTGKIDGPATAENCAEVVAAYRVGKKAAGAMLDGREWREFPLPQQRGPVAGGPGPGARG